MAKFKNIQKNQIGFSTPLAGSVVRQETSENRKKEVEVRARAQKAEAKKRSQEPAAKPVASRATGKPRSSSRLGKSVIVLSLVVVIQIVLLISLLYLTPSLIR